MGKIVRYRGPWERGGQSGQQYYQRRGRRPWRGYRSVLLGLGVLAGAGIGQYLSGGPLPDVQRLAANVTTVIYPSPYVIDGDTIDYGGQRIRMLDYDAPEIGEPKCASELELGKKATQRLKEILRSGAIEVRPSGSRDVDQYGRKLRLVLVNGRSVGDTLIAEGLAWPWEGRRHFWCG